MIFVTVGTHEQQFDRLLKELDELKKSGVIEDEVFVQTGYSTYDLKYCQSKQFLTYEEMEEYMDKASLVITHGGPASFMNALSRDKKTIIVPRLKKYDEHINDHQLEFLKMLQLENKSIRYVTDISGLKEFILNTVDMGKFISNNGKFCSEFEKICAEI